MASLTLAYEGLHIRVSANPKDLDWLEEFLLPWFAATGDPPDVTVTLSHDRSRFQALLARGAAGGHCQALMLDTRTVDLPRWNAEGNGLVLYDDAHRLFYRVSDQHIELVAETAHADQRLDLMRVVRELAMGVAQVQGHRFLHASAFARHGRAAIITGRRKAGKTSLLTYVLSQSPADYLSNDRLLVRPDTTTTNLRGITLRGMPTIVSIRDGTLALFPGMGADIARRGYRSRASLADTQEPGRLQHIPVKPEGAGVTPRQFCALWQREPVAQAQAAALLFPQRTGLPGGLTLRRLEPDEAESRLREGLFGHIGPDRLSEVFTVFPPRLTCGQAPDDAGLCRRLAAAVPAWECQLGNDSYRDSRGAQRLLALLAGDPHAGTDP